MSEPTVRTGAGLGADDAGRRVPAMGGTRTVPTPDAIARDYLLLALRLGQRIEGFVDGYFGPAELKATTDTEPLRAPARLVDDAGELAIRVSGLPPGDRRDWLARQLVALERHARELLGERVAYLDHVEACFDWRPTPRPGAVFDEAADEIDRLLPGPGSVAERLAAWDDRLTVAPDRLEAVLDWLVATFRGRAAALFGLPEGESVRIGTVRGQAWSGYNWYEGGYRSRFDLNLDLPIRAPDLVRVVAHETYPGHHLENAWKEADLVERQGRLESSVLLLNTPECLISEGLADLGVRFAAPPAHAVELVEELFGRAGIDATSSASGRGARAGSVRELAERSVALDGPRRRLAEVAVNAAILRHADGASHDEVLGYLERVGRLSPERAAKRLEFIEHPLSRTYVFNYYEGEALLSRWLDAVPGADRPARFGRLLHEQLTPSAVAAELAG